MTDRKYKYWAFLSYSPQDNREQRADTQEAGHRCWGDWLHDALKTFPIPAEFAGQINGRGEIIPERIAPIFREEQELPEAASLSAEIREALEQSNCLVVICSPRSAKSLRVNEAVRYFKQLGRGQHILPIVVAGEPNASDDNKPDMDPKDECFVPALRHPVQADGTIDPTRRTGRCIFVDARHGADKREILPNDHRNAEADLEMAKIQLIALLIGVGFNGLWWREQKRHFFDFAEARHQAREALHQVEEVRHQLQEAQRQTRAAQNQALETQNLPRDVHGQIQEAQNQTLEAQNQVREAQKQLQEFQNKIRDTQTQLEAARNRALAAESKVLAAQHQAREAQNQLEETRNQAREARNKVLEIQNQPQDVADQLKQAHNQVLEAQNQTQNAQSQLEETRHQAEVAQNQFLAAQSQVQEFQNQARSAQTQLEAARNQICESQSNVLAVQNQVREAQKQVQEIQNKSWNTRPLTKVFAVLAVLAIMAAGMAARQAWRQRQVASQALAQAVSEAAGKFELAPDESDPERIRQVLQNIGGAEQAENRRRSLDELAVRIPRSEIPEALKSSSVVVNDQQRSHFQKWLLVRLGWVDPLSAMTNASTIAGKIVNDEGLSDSNLYLQLAVLDNWMWTDLPGAFNWVRQLPDADSRQRALEEIIHDPVLAIQLRQHIAALPAGDDQKAAINDLLSLWAPTEPEAAVNWLAAFPETNAQPAEVQSVILAWSQRDPAAAAQWLTDLPAETVSDEMVSAFLAGAVEKYPEFAWQWTQAVTDETQRQKFQLQVARQWMEFDPFTATQWINRQDLPPEIMPPQKTPRPCHEVLSSSNVGIQIFFPIETEILSNAMNGPMEIKPKE